MLVWCEGNYFGFGGQFLKKKGTFEGA